MIRTVIIENIEYKHREIHSKDSIEFELDHVIVTFRVWFKDKTFLEGKKAFEFEDYNRIEKELLEYVNEVM